jgi:hypothetical protein
MSTPAENGKTTYLGGMERLWSHAIAWAVVMWAIPIVCDGCGGGRCSEGERGTD